MSNLSDDIIRYKKGELSPKEMHALEKKALSDPFLADALEGADTISAHDFSSDIQSIQEKIKGGGKSSLFTPLRIAAGILLVAVASFLVYQLTPKPEKLALTKNKENSSAKTDSVKSPAKLGNTMTAKPQPKPEISKTETKPQIAKAKEKIPTTTNAASGHAQPIDQNSLAQTGSQPGNVKLAEPVTSSELASEDAQLSPKDEKEAIAASVATPTAEAKRKEVVQSSRMAKSVTADAQKKISGQVLSAEDGTPMPGVNVMVKGTIQGTVTDASGYFQMNLTQPNQSLVFSFVGYEAKEINVDEKDKMDVALKEDATQLSEVVVTGYRANDPNAEPIIKLAEPVGGRKAYDKYLDDNIRYPQQALENKVKGRVVVEFTVREDGSIDEFNVIKKLGYGCDEEVIRLVKAGPAWKPTTQDNVPVESNVRVRMKFSPDGKK